MKHLVPVYSWFRDGYRQRDGMGWNCILSYCLVLLAVDAGVKTVHAERSLNLSVSRHANEAGVGFEVEENSATVRQEAPYSAEPSTMMPSVALYWRTTCT